MKKITTNRIIKKALGATLAACISFGSMFAVMPIYRVHAADGVKTVNSTIGSDIAIGVSGLKDPTKSTVESGDMYIPSDYIYFGNNNKGAMLWRVLSTNTDSAGNEGYTFVMSEYLEAASKSGKSYDDSYLSYFTDAEKNALAPALSEEGSTSDLYGNSWSNAVPTGLLFAPSAEEINNYVANFSGASTLRAYTDASRSTSGAWWLRSTAGEGNGAVSEAGEVFVESNTGSAMYYNRIAANIDISNVIYSAKVDGGWRLAVLDSEYAEKTQTNFAAWITDIDGTEIEISYVNAKPMDTSDLAGEYISIIVTDADGNVKQYKQLHEVSASSWEERSAYDEEGNMYTGLGEYFKFQGSVSVDVSGIYDQAAGDKIYAFWEKTYDNVTLENNPTLAYETTTASRLIELCWHEEDPNFPATCTTFAVCIVCGMHYGDYNFQSYDAHVEVIYDYHTGEITGYGESGLEWTCKLGSYLTKDSNGSYIWKERYQHQAYCNLCHVYLPVDENMKYSGAEPCQSSSAEIPTCVYAVKCDYCGNMFTDPENHTFDGNGICSNNAHFKKPYLKDGVYQINTVGELIWYGEYVNSFTDGSAMEGAILLENIDFSILSEYEGFGSYTWTPMGINDPYNGTFDGNGHSITNLNVEVNYYNADTDNKSAAFIANAKGAEIKNLGIVEANIANTFTDTNAYSAILVAYGDSDNTITNCYVKDSEVSGKQNVGGIASYLSNADGLQNCYAIDLYLTKDEKIVKGWIINDFGNGKPFDCFAYGDDAGVFGEDGTYNADGTHCYYLSDTGSPDSDQGAKTAEHFESGLVAYYVGGAFGQTIDTDDYPVLGGDKVYRVSICGATGDNKYTYSNDNDTQHVSDGNKVCGEQLTCKNCGEKFGDAVDHAYTAFDPQTGFIWSSSYESCNAQTYCVHCGIANPELMKATVNWDFDGVKAEYVATLYIVDEEDETKQYTSDVVRFIIKTIDEVTGILPSTEIFTGDYYSAHDLVTNTKMYGSEYDAYFLLDGEMVGTEARDVGVYDLYIVGSGRFAYQTYTYEDFFTIEKVEVEMTVSVKEKICDDKSDFEFEVTFSNGVDYSHILNITADQSKLPSAEVGEYEITGIGFEFYDEYDVNNITITHNKTALARVLPRNYVEIKNKSYKTEYTYNGKPITAPTAEDFSVDEGSKLRFTWYKDGVLVNNTPVDAGEYILRVSASATDEYIASSVEITVTVAPAKLELVLDSYENYDHVIEDYYGETRVWYRFQFGDLIDPVKQGLIKVTGFMDGHTLESEGIEIIYKASQGNNGSDLVPTLPDNNNYYMRVSMHQTNNFGSTSNYSLDADVGFYLIIEAPKNTVTPINKEVTYDGNAHNIDLLVGFNRSDIADPYISNTMTEFDYRTQIYLDVGLDWTTRVDNVKYSPGSTKQYETFAQCHVEKSGVYYVKSEADLYVPEILEDNEILLFAKITVSITDQDGKEVTEIKDVGTYTVSVTVEMLDESGNVISTPVVNEGTVKVNKELWIIVKETEVNLDGSVPEYDEKDILFIPGYTLSAGHRIVDLTYNVQVGSGLITIIDWLIEDEEGNDVSDEYVIKSGMIQWYEKNYEAHGYNKEYKYPYLYSTHAEGLYGIVHIYSNACDSTCNVEKCTATRTVEPHKGGKATCTVQAICEVCGEEYGGYDYSEHTGTGTIYVQNQKDFNYHDLVMACCGTVISTEKHTIVKVATCNTLAECKLCGEVRGSYDYTNHTSTEMYYATSAEDASMHEYRHVCCDIVESTEAHTGGEATCTVLAVCETCKLSYGKLDGDNHSSDELEYTAIKNSSVNHDVSHACCGAYIETEFHFGGEATCTSKAKCQGCGAEYGEIDSSNHTSDEYTYSAATIGNLHYVYRSCCGASIGEEEHSGGSATCTSQALCEYCGAAYGEKDPSTHSSDKFTYSASSSDSSKHDKLAACCGAFLATEDHKGGDVTCTHKATCTLCGNTYGELGDHTYDDVCDAFCNVCEAERLAGHFDSDKNGECDRCGALVDLENNTGNENGNETEKGNETETSDNQQGGCTNGCGSSLGVGSVSMMLTVAIAGFALIRRKKEI